MCTCIVANISATFRLQPSLAEQDCSIALLLEPANIKALYRRGLARKKLSKFSEAARDLSDLLKLDQGNMVATKELESVKTLWRKVRYF